MIKFISKTLLFLVINTMIIISFIFFTIKINYADEIIVEKFRNSNILVLGDSHTECAINDSLFNCINLSKSAEAYIYSFIKLQYINNITKIDTVILSCRPKSLIKIDDDRWLKDKRILINKLSSLAPICKLEELSYLYNINSIAVIQAYVKSTLVLIKTTFKSLFNMIILDDYNIGGYNYLVRNKLDESLKFHKNQKISKNLEFSYYQNDYLEKIMKYCNQKGIVLILIEPPTYIDDIEMRHFTEDKFKEYKKRYNFIYLNHSNFRLKEGEYGDISHLNYKGAKPYSEYLNYLFKK